MNKLKVVCTSLTLSLVANFAIAQEQETDKSLKESRTEYREALEEFKSGRKEINKAAVAERKALNDKYLSDIAALNARADAEFWPNAKRNRKSQKLATDYMNALKQVGKDRRAEIKTYRSENARPKRSDYITRNPDAPRLTDEERAEYRADRAEYRSEKKETRRQARAATESLSDQYLEDLKALHVRARTEKWNSDQLNEASMALANAYMDASKSVRKQTREEIRANAKPRRINYDADRDCANSVCVATAIDPPASAEAGELSNMNQLQQQSQPQFIRTEGVSTTGIPNGAIRTISSN
jgi:hypothetical protein